MRDEDHRERVPSEIFLEPVARFEVEMIRRLVKQQQVRAAEQQLRQRNPHLPAAGKCFRRSIGVVRCETKATEDRCDTQVHAVAVREAKAVLQLAVAGEHFVVLALRDRRIAEPMLDLVHFHLHIEERLECTARFLEDTPARVRESVLRQVTDCQIGWLDDRPGVGVVKTGEHLQQCRFAGAVWST